MPSNSARVLNEATRMAALDHWKRWFKQRFRQEFKPEWEQTKAGKLEGRKTDEEIHRFLITVALNSGNAVRGAQVFRSARCQSCHGDTPVGNAVRRIGPDLAGVTRRLFPRDLADAIVYPSRQVEDRYKLRAIKLRDGTLLRGIVSGENADTVTVGAAEWEHRVPRAQVISMQPQPVSLMPDRLLNRLTWDEIRDLMTFLDSLGNAAKQP